MKLDIADRIKVVETRLREVYNSCQYTSYTQTILRDCMADLVQIREQYADEWEELELYRRGLKK